MTQEQRKLSWSEVREIFLYSLWFLFFIQLLTDFIEAVYAFGLLGTSIPPEIVSVLFLFAPALLLVVKRGLSEFSLRGIGVAFLACRVIEVLLDTRSRMLVAGLGVALFLLFFTTWLVNRGKMPKAGLALRLSLGWLFAIAALIALRVVYSGFDLSLDPVYIWISLILAGFAVLLWFWPVQNVPATPEVATNESQPESFSRVTVWTLGLMAAWVLVYFAFGSPNVIARWTGESYPGIIVIGTLALVGSGLFMTRPAFWKALKPVWLWIWNGMFLICLVGTISAHQVAFPLDPTAYPLAEPSPAGWAKVCLVGLLALYPVILVDLKIYFDKILYGRVSLRSLAGAFSLAALFLLIIIFTQVFTTVYDYIPVIGPVFRDRFWLVFLIPGLLMLLPLCLVKELKADEPHGLTLFSLVAIGLTALISILGLVFVSARPVAPSQPARTLKVFTYNLQQGYSKTGNKNYRGQLAVLQQADADVIGLQEMDTNRIAGGNSDIVRYFADRLNYYSYYGPKTVTGTFGIALLSRYPIQNPRTFFMYSAGEQTATIAAQITVAGKTLNVFVTHLGNGGPVVQQQALLQEIQGKDNVIAMGDFNFRPDTEQYRLTCIILEDAWLLKWPTGADTQGRNPIQRIDHIFVSPGTKVNEAWYLADPASDHPAVMIEIAP